MDAEDGDGNQRTRISPEAVSALFGLFTNKQWLPQLPRGSKLTGDSDYSALASKYGFDRTQAARQYVKWREWGQASNERDQTNPVDREPVRFLLKKRAPDNQKVVDAAFVALLKHPFLSERVWFHDTLKEIELRGNALWMSRVSELGDLFVKHYSSASSKQRCCSTNSLAMLSMYSRVAHYARKNGPRTPKYPPFSEILMKTCHEISTVTARASLI